MYSSNIFLPSSVSRYSSWKIFSYFFIFLNTLWNSSTKALFETYAPQHPFEAQLQDLPSGFTII